MNFKSRLKSVEWKLDPNKYGIKFSQLLSQELIYRGKSFDSITEMYQKLKIVDFPTNLSDKNLSILLEKKIISVVSIVKCRNQNEMLVTIKNSD